MPPSPTRAKATKAIGKAATKEMILVKHGCSQQAQQGKWQEPLASLGGGRASERGSEQACDLLNYLAMLSTLNLPHCATERLNS
eukprot:2316871-Alexandrium_andersonii.AAC.1